MWSFDLKTGSKTRWPDLPYGRANFISFAIGDFIYIFSGQQSVDMIGNAQDTGARWGNLKYLIHQCTSYGLV